MSTRRTFFKHLSGWAALWQMARASRDSFGGPWQSQPASPPSISPPHWLEEGIVSASYMEPLEFYVRRGDAPADVAERWKEDFNEAGLKRYKEMGINLVFMPLHKGMGLKSEAESIEASRKYTEIAHRYDIKVAGYVGSSIFYETFYSEEPDATHWEQVDERGRPMYYGEQTFRHAACRNNPGYRAFLRKVIRLGIQDLKLDLLHFDQLQWWPEPWSCHCEYCQGGFRAFLKKSYTPEQLKARLGFSDLEGIRVPDFNLNTPPVRLPELKDPLMQEWARFRCASLAEWWGETRAYIRELNPEVALLGNPTMAPAINGGFIYGFDLPQLLLHSELIWSEEANQPRWTTDGRLVSLTRSYKAARSMGRSLMITQGLHMEGPRILRVAEAIAYNDLNVGVVAGGWEFGSNRFPDEIQRYVNFFRSHVKDLAHTTPVTDVAILRSFASIEFNPARSNVSTVLFEQVLIQCKFPFGIVYDHHLRDLSRHKVLVLANQDALSDQQADQIRRFVEAGGGLVATEDTSLLTEWRRKRDKFGLAEVLGIDGPPDRRRSKSGTPGVWERPRSLSSSHRTGRDATACDDELLLQQSVLAVAEELRRVGGGGAVGGAGRVSVEVDAPLWVTMELAEQKSTNTWLLHLLDFRQEEPLENIPIRVRIPEGMRLREAVLESPEGLSTQMLSPLPQPKVISLPIPKLNVYCLVLMRWENE